MSTPLDLPLLLTAVSAGGSSALASVTELEPAGGAHAAIAPARYTDARGNANYHHEKRYIDGVLRHTVTVDSKASQLNRIEIPLSQEILTNSGVFAQVPRASVTYEDERTFLDTELPHRIFDGHFRAGTLDGTNSTTNSVYKGLRDASPVNARAVLEAAPAALVLGAWDSSRKANQARYRSALTGEIIGVIAGAGESETHTQPSRRSGARVDPVGASVRLAEKDYKSLIADQSSELSTKTQGKIKKEKDGLISGSPLGLGSIPPGLSDLSGIACERIIRTHVLSFAALRQLRFGAGAEGDTACRAVLAAFALAGLARSDAELLLRANCDLREKAEPIVTLDLRGGKTQQLQALDIEAADALLTAAIAHAREVAGLNWNGQELKFVGNPKVIAGAVDTEEGEGE